MQKKLLILFLFGLFAISNVFAQDRKITGKVTGANDGQTLPGVSVRIKGSTGGTQTDINGIYTINIPANATTLIFSYIGFINSEVVIGSKTQIDVALTQDDKQLTEVVVTGYQTKVKTSVSSSLSVVSGKEIADKPVPSIDNLLQGKAAGVQVTTENGRPGANAYIRIRGTGSVNAGQQPLLVVDGVQVPDDVAPQFYTTLNANDIKNITVLKDAASVSLYGARGSNGVVLITTKNGSESESRVTYSFQYGTNKKLADNFTLMSPAQKLKYEYDLGYENPDFTLYLSNNGLGDKTLFDITSAQRQAGWNALIKQSHNWMDDILRSGRIMQHQVTISGHEKKTNYYVSFQKYDQAGITIGSDLNRYTGKINLSTEVKPWFSISNNLSLGQRSTNELRDIYNAQNPFVAMYSYNPYEPIFNKDGSYNITSQSLNVIEALKNNPENQKYLDGYNTTTLDLHPIKGLNVSSQFGMTYNDYKRDYFVKPGSILDGYIADPTAPGEKTDNGSTEFSYDWVNKAIYKFSVGEDHHFSALAVQEFQKDQFSSYSLSKKGFASGDLGTQDNGAANDGTNSTSKAVWTIASLLGELDYNYKEKYYVTGSYRRDGSSRFGADNKYGNFYSASASWLLNQEDFLKGISWINVLKLRGSIGSAGNFSGIGNYQSLGLFRYGKYNNQLTAVPSQVPNSDLTWEKKLKRDIGVDFELFDGRITGAFDYYNENTTALLFNVPLSQTTGFTNVVRNVGAMTNKGIDMALSVDVVRYKGFKWNVYGNINYNKNNVTELYNGSTEIDDLNGLGVVKPGYPINTFKLVRYAGVNSATGAAQYYDKTGKITEEYSSDDAVILKDKSPNPKFFGGFGTNLSYKGIELSGDFTYTLGNYVFNYNKETLVSWGGGVYTAQATDALNYWKKPGDKNVLPKPDANATTYDTDLYLQKASYIRLKNVTLAYTIPKNITQKVHVQGLRVFITGENLLTINPNHFFGDPEVGIGSAESFATTIPGQATLFSYPNTRQLTFGVDVTF
ncbi:TonB-linked outer membrane protein, SusC/RagA family [Mucilaginibacter pineti]|uniref:TonB-linked outer membrane protein, SusC/RagA family n=1 Tax=Mucilaginibacter pineti TaxID=1391627 RepID=A0A1G6XV03_9SPHI|nr:SusC/RagA family TonB-linked outer membrane protein [Mucilaginibacter pineti]SDD82018.1 TonB-linked outer membrane protein, SusC/RagA family [Mucilaginibacter pineti]